MSFNILVIDDDKTVVERLMKNLKRADEADVIGEIRIDDSLAKESELENYDPTNKFGIKFDVVLIDYQLGCTFTGILVSAWMSLIMKVPRITLNTAPYPGGTNYFNDFILKREITDTPTEVLQKIIGCIENYDEAKWLEEQHKLLVQQYQRILKEKTGTPNSLLANLENLLDKFEKIIDSKQEATIKQVLATEEKNEEFLTKLQNNEMKIKSLKEQLEKYIEEKVDNE